MASPRSAPFELVGRGGLPGQVALVASATLGQSVAAQAPSQSGWFRGTWWRGPKWAGAASRMSMAKGVHCINHRRCAACGWRSASCKRRGGTRSAKQPVRAARCCRCGGGAAGLVWAAGSSLPLAEPPGWATACQSHSRKQMARVGEDRRSAAAEVVDSESPPKSTSLSFGANGSGASNHVWPSRLNRPMAGRPAAAGGSGVVGSASASSSSLAMVEFGGGRHDRVNKGRRSAAVDGAGCPSRSERRNASS